MEEVVFFQVFLSISYDEKERQVKLHCNEHSVYFLIIKHHFKVFDTFIKKSKRPTARIGHLSISSPKDYEI